MTRVIRLPNGDGSLQEYTPGPSRLPERSSVPPTSRHVYAAAHVVADPWRVSMGSEAGCVDWEATLTIRQRIWAAGLGVAEAMDTAQRGMGITWPDVRTLVSRTLSDPDRGPVVVGIATDQLVPGGRASLTKIVEAYLEQLEFVEGLGGDAVLMASRHLAATATSPDDYVDVYSRILSAANRPVILHWLGSVFDPQLAGYWGSDDYGAASEVVLRIMEENITHVRGIKMSLLDASLEKDFRRRLPEGVRMFTGDDYNYPELIAGNGREHSDALLGAFAYLAPFAAAAVRRLDVGDEAGFRAILDPTVPLSRVVFEAPTQFYKSGVAWLSYLSGFQTHFTMLGGLQAGRSLIQLADTYRLADGIGLFPDPDLAARRVSDYLQGVAGL